MNKQISCKNCNRIFWSPSRKMFIIWKTDVEGNKLETFGAYYTFDEANVKPLELKDTEYKLIEKFYLPKKDYCGSCMNLVKSINKRAALDRNKRKKELGIKGNKAIPIPDADAKGFIRFLVSKSVEQEGKERVKNESANKK